FQVIAHLVRLDVLLCQDLADRPLGQFRKARMTGGRPVTTGMGGQQRGATGRGDNPTPSPSGKPAAPTQVFAPPVMTGSRPARGRSSSASIIPSSAARSRQRVTVWCVTAILRATS